MSRRTSGSRTSPAIAAVEPEGSSNSSSSSSIETVIPGGNRRDSLIAIRDRLALETADTLWQRHKSECHCICGMGDGRMLVSLVKELRAVMDEIEALPGGGEVSKSDELAKRRASRIADASGQ